MVQTISPIRNPRLLATLSAECYIKHKAISLEEEFHSIFRLKTFFNDAVSFSRISGINHTMLVSPDLMSKYISYV